VEQVCSTLEVSERRACKVLGQPRSTQRYERRLADDEPHLISRILALVKKYGRYGYRRITALLRKEGWRVNHKRVERIWRQEGLKVPQKQPKRGRLWLNDGSCVRHRPEHRNHVWAYDFVHDRTHDGRAIRLLIVVDEYTRECLAIEVDRRLNSQDVLRVLARLFLEQGTPEYLRSDNVLTAQSNSHSLRHDPTYPTRRIQLLPMNWLRQWSSTLSGSPPDHSDTRSAA
jgi:transposase InsO family protein